MTRSKTAVHRIHDGNAEWLVRGTSDPDEALKILLEEGDYYDLDAYCEVPEGEEDLYDAVAVPERCGLFRINPVHPDSDYGWMLGEATKRGPGVFEGVLMDVKFERNQKAGLDQDIEEWDEWLDAP